MEKCRIIEGLVDYISERYRSAAEIGIGHFPDVALSLVEKGMTVLATDIYPFRHGGLNVIVDDVTSPDPSVYDDIELLYAMRPPSELVPYMKRAAGRFSADLIVRPLSSEYMDGRLIRHKCNTFYLWSFKKVAIDEKY